MLIAIVVGQLGIFVLKAPTVSAEGWNINLLNGELPLEVDGQVSEPNCTIDKMPMTGKIAYSHPVGARGVSPVGLGDAIKVYVDIKPTVPGTPTGASTVAPLKKLQENCARQAKEGILNFRLKITNYTGINSEQDFSYVAKLKSEPDGQFALNFPDIILNNLKKITVRVDDTVRFTIAVDFRGTKYKDIATVDFLVQQASVTTTDVIPTGFESKESDANPNSEVRKLEEIRVQSTMLDKYRVLYDETGAFEKLKFGSNGLKAIKLNWKDSNSSVARGNYIELPAEYDVSYWPDLTPRFNEFQTSFNFEDKVPKSSTGCIWDRGWFFREVNCEKAVFYNKSIYGEVSTVKAGSLAGGVDFDPVIYEKAWQDRKPADVIADGKTDKEGKPLYSVSMAHLPMMWLDGSFATSRDFVVLMNREYSKFTIEVFNTVADIKAACIADGLAEDLCSDPAKMRYSVGKEVITTGGTNAAPAPTAAQTLYGFITRVISDLIILIQSWLFRIFAYIVVPILNALLRVRPYEDAFVNVIYPGWLILRNLANIFFIVSLLVVGLRILFQLSASGTAVGFIRRLLIMALLVNFSLVISQGIIGIADTVQSQFLPGNTKIIEALGQKLMVEPLKNFREEITHKDQGVFNSENSEAALSDTIKPIVLLILSIAAFFSFIAIAAFLMIRLVVLWVLYMISPIAYVGFIMEETKKYASQWWSEFIKQAMLAPILVFFLNIAALMATTFSTSGANNLFTKFNPDGSLSGDVVIGSLTILTHFIVIGFLFAGMKFALSFGGIGSKAIVGYARKGFDAATTGAAKLAGKGALGAGKWAKDTGSDALASSKMLEGKFGLQRAIRGLARPIEAGKAIKKGYFDEPKAEMNKRFTETFKGMSDELQPWGENKLFPAQMLLRKLTGKDDKDRAQADALESKASILTAEELRELKQKKQHDWEALRLVNSGQMSVEDGKEHLASLKRQIDDTKEEIKKAVLPSEQARLLAKKTDLETKHANLTGAIDAAVSAGDDNFKITPGPVAKALATLFNATEVRDALKESIRDSQTKIADNNRLKKLHGVTGDMTEDLRRELEGEAQTIKNNIQKRERPYSDALDKAQTAEALKEKKEIAEANLDYDQLEYGFTNALKKNNKAMARAFLMQMAENGQIDKLLKNSKQDNNIFGLEKLIKQNIKGTARNQIQIIREVSNIAAKNGNLHLGFAVKSIHGGGGEMRSIEKQLKEVSDKLKKLSIKETKPSDIVYKDPKPGGKESLIPGMVDHLNTYNNQEKLKVIRRDMSPAVAKEILDKLSPKEIGQLSREVHQAIKEVAVKRK